VSYWSGSYFTWGRPRKSAVQRRADAARAILAATRRGKPMSPIVIEGRTIARTFWGKAWCEHLERYCDFANRLPRGRTYVRNGSVVHLTIGRGRVEALVQGTELYDVEVTIAALPKPRWKKIVGECSGQIDSLVELLQGKLSNGVMKVVTDPKQGLFPPEAQIGMECSCPDHAGMCKHLAAVLYGTGARLDTKPELLFLLRGVDHLELLDGAGTAKPKEARRGEGRRKPIASADLSSVFGIEIDGEDSGKTQ